MNNNLITKLNNNVNVPRIAFGMFKLENSISNQDLIVKAIKLGYRHFDTATWYNNEKMLGDAIKESKIDRNKLFITTKLHNDTRGYQKTKDAIDLSLKLLQTDYIDLYLLHWPAPIKFRHNYNYYNLASWKAIEEYYLEGKIKAIGVSNFKVHHFENFYDQVKIKPMVNQIEIHPGYHDDEVIAYCKRNNIAIAAYSPLGRGNLINDPLILNMAKNYNCSSAQLLIQYVLSQHDLCIVKTTNEKHLLDNLNSINIKINENDLKLLNSENSKANRFSKDPDTSNQ